MAAPHIDFNISGATLTSVTPYQTSASNQLAQLGAVSVSNNTFTYSLPGQSITTFVGTGGGTCTPTAIIPYISVSGTWTEESSATVSSTSTAVDLGPQPISGGTWSWTGPNGFTSTAREIDNIALSAGANAYTATYTNSCGDKSTQVFTITAPGASGSPIAIDAGGAVSGSWGRGRRLQWRHCVHLHQHRLHFLALPGPCPRRPYCKASATAAAAHSRTPFPDTHRALRTLSRCNFVENYVTGSGDREFNVLINGTQVLTNFDVYAAAGGQFKAIQKSFSTTANSSGQIL